MYKVVFFADELRDHMWVIKEKLELEFNCFTSNKTDEYRQVFYQSGKFVLLFSDAKNALIFRQTTDENLLSLEFEIMVYLHTDSAFKEDSQRILNENHIHVFRNSDSDKLIQRVNSYLLKKNPELETDLEFYMPPDNQSEDEDKNETPDTDSRKALSSMRRLRKHAGNGKR